MQLQIVLATCLSGDNALYGDSNVAFKRSNSPPDCPPLCPLLCASMSPFSCPPDRTLDTSADCPPYSPVDSPADKGVAIKSCELIT